MGHNQVINNALHSPPSSPTGNSSASRKGKPSKNRQPTPLTPTTPTIVHSGNKRLAPSPSNDSSAQHERPTQKQRTTNNSWGNGIEDKLEYFSEEGSSSLDGLVRNMDEMVKMVRRVGGNGMEGLMSDPLLVCLVSVQTVIMACTAQLISSRSSPAAATSSTNRDPAANGHGDGAVNKKMKHSQHKNFN